MKSPSFDYVEVTVVAERVDLSIFALIRLPQCNGRWHLLILSEHHDVRHVVARCTDRCSGRENVNVPVEVQQSAVVEGGTCEK